MLRLALALILLSACTVDDRVAPPEPAETSDPEPSTEPEQPSPAAQPAAPEPPPLSPDVTPVQDLSRAIQQLGRLMTALREAIQEAAENAEGDDCAKARTIFLASNQALRAFIAEDPLPGGRTPPFWQVAAPDEFARKCHQLPPAVQRCLRLDLRHTDRSTCTPLLRELPDDQQALVDAIARSAQEPQPGQ